MGHGGHWEAIYPYDEDEPLKIVIETAQSGVPLNVVQRKLPNNNGFKLWKWPRTKKCQVLGMSQDFGPYSAMTIMIYGSGQKSWNIWTGYPYLNDGLTLPLQIVDIEVWANGIEAEITCKTADGFLITFFDTHYFQHSDRYWPGATETFTLGALAMTLEPAELATIPLGDTEIQPKVQAFFDSSGIEVPTEVSTKGMTALYPMQDMCASDYQFLSLARAVHPITTENQKFHLVEIGLPGPEAMLNLPLLAGSSILDGYVPVEGTDVGGVLWLHGRLNV